MTFSPPHRNTVATLSGEKQKS